MKNYAIHFLAFCSCLVFSAQAQNIEWAKSTGGTNLDAGNSIAVDAAGNIYAAGRFGGTSDFDPSPTSTFNLTATGLNDVYITRLSPDGSFQWAKCLSGTNNYSNATSLALDGSANIYVTGYFRNTVDFDPGPGIYTLTSDSLVQDDIFILKLDSMGNFLWAHRFGEKRNDQSLALAVEKTGQGNVYFTGYFSGTVDFDPDSAGTYTLSTTMPTDADIFVTKLDSAGHLVWAKKLGGTYPLEQGSAIALDANSNVYTTGWFSGTEDFDPDTSVIYNLVSQGGSDIYISRLDSAGHFVWAKQIGGTNADQGHCITVDSFGYVYATGTFQSTVDFDPGPGISNLSAIGSSDIFVSKYDTSGNLTWARQFGGAGAILKSTTVLVDMAGHVYTGGMFWGNIDFDPGAATGILNGGIHYTIFISRLDSAGHFDMARKYGGSTDDACYGGTLDASGNLYLTGHFNSNSLNLCPNTLVKHGTNYDDAFYAKLTPVTTLTVSSCDHYISPTGLTWTRSGDYMDKIPNAMGCDSIVSYELTILSVDTSVIQSGPTLTAQATGAAFQWLDCNNGRAPIPGETNPSYTAAVTGSYAVVVTENGCTDTSACFPVTVVGLDEIHGLKYDISIYPNPAEDETVIQSAQTNMEKIELRNVIGQSVLAIQPGDGSGKRVILNTSQIAPGMYYVTVYSNTGTSTFKVARK